MKTAPPSSDHRENIATASIGKEHNADDVDNDADNDTEEEEDMPDVRIVLEQFKMQHVSDPAFFKARRYWISTSKSAKHTGGTLYPLLVRLDHLRFDKSREMQPRHSKGAHALFHFTFSLQSIF